jgi:hypothetical protein
MSIEYSNNLEIRKKYAEVPQMQIRINDGYFKGCNPYVFKNQENLNLLLDFLHSKDKGKFQRVPELSIRIGLTNYNEEVFNKFKKAFTHLVELYGGKVIDDLF